MLRSYITRVIVFLCVGAPFLARGQDVEAILKSDPLEVQGQLRFDQFFNYRFVDSLRFADQYGLLINGQVNAKIYSIDFPFQFSYTNKQEDYSHPFDYNRFGTQPHYKWLTAYFGYNSLSFSPYTLSGHQFLGVGFTVAPETIPVETTVVYGRLMKAVDYDSANYVLPTYDRRFYSYDLKYNQGKVSLATSGIYAWDFRHSVSAFPDSLGIAPKENFAVAFNGGYTIAQNWHVSVEFGHSILTNDVTSTQQLYNDDFLLFPSNKTTRGYNAYGGKIRYMLKKTSIGVQYKHVDPGYETLGAYYTNNDLQQLTLLNTTKLYEGRLNVSLNIGLERDNLSLDNMMTNKRLAGSLNLSAMPNDNISLNGSYSSFQSFSNMRSNFDFINNEQPVELMDTLNYRQINQSLSLSGAYNLQQEGRVQSTSLNISGNTSGSSQDEGGQETYLMNSTISHILTFTKTGFTLAASVYNSFVRSMSDQFTTGPVMRIGTTFFDKMLRGSLQGSINRSWNNGKRSNLNGNARLMLSMAVKKVHQIAFTGGYYHTKSYTGLDTQKNLQFRLSYSYRIQHKFIRKNTSHE
jgi:hypothetical protein